MLLEMKPLMDMVRLVLQTGYIKNIDTPVNLLVIAKPESGKTSAMSLFKIKGTYTTNNITQSVVVSKILPMIENHGLKHLIIPDILNCIEKAKSTRDSFINLMKSLIEEGVTSLDQFNVRTNKVYNPPVKCGMITAITSGSYHGHYNPLTSRTEGGVKHYWKKIGMLSRFVPFSYRYDLSKIMKIFRYIEREEYNDKPKKRNPKYRIWRSSVVVRGDSELFRQLELISSKVGKEVGAYGLRLQKSLQSLTKASARLDRRRKIEQKDIDRVIKLSNWINYEFNPL